MSGSRKVAVLALLLASFVLVLLGSVETASAQCAMCRAALEQNGGKLVDGFNHAILFLLVMPYLVFGSIALSWYWKRNRPKAAARAGEVPILLEETGS
jgi:hypothetical protein